MMNLTVTFECPHCRAHGTHAETVADPIAARSVDGAVSNAREVLRSACRCAAAQNSVSVAMAEAEAEARAREEGVDDEHDARHRRMKQEGITEQDIAETRPEQER